MIWYKTLLRFSLPLACRWVKHLVRFGVDEDLACVVEVQLLLLRPEQGASRVPNPTAPVFAHSDRRGAARVRV